MSEVDEDYGEYKCPFCGHIAHAKVMDLGCHANVFCTKCDAQLNNVKRIPAEEKEQNG